MEVTTSAAKPSSPGPTSRESFEADLDAGWDLDEPTRSDDAAPIAGPPRTTSGQFVVSSPRRVEAPPPANGASSPRCRPSAGLLESAPATASVRPPAKGASTRPAAPSKRPEVPPPPGPGAVGIREKAGPTPRPPPSAVARIPARANMRPASAPPRPGSKSEPCEVQPAIAAVTAFARFALRPRATGRHDSAPPVIEVAPASDADLAALALMDDSAP